MKLTSFRKLFYPSKELKEMILIQYENKRFYLRPIHINIDDITVPALVANVYIR